jgi:hypothetical protein
MFLLAVYLFGFRSGDNLLLFPIAWFFTTMATPLGIIAWYFALEAIMPLLVMTAFTIHSLTLENRKPDRERPRTNISKGWQTAIITNTATD